MEKISKRFEEWDIWILDHVFQRVADFIWRETSFSCFNLARLALTLSQGIYVYLGKNGSFLFFPIVVMISGLNQIQIFESLTRGKFANPARIIFRFLRMFVIAFYTPGIILLGLSFADWLARFEGILFVSFFYFVSCQSRPPALKARKQQLAFNGT